MHYLIYNGDYGFGYLPLLNRELSEEALLEFGNDFYNVNLKLNKIMHFDDKYQIVVNIPNGMHYIVILGNSQYTFQPFNIIGFKNKQDVNKFVFDELSTINYASLYENGPKIFKYNNDDKNILMIIDIRKNINNFIQKHLNRYQTRNVLAKYLPHDIEQEYFQEEYW